MKKLKITMLGAGSGFVISIAKELVEHKIFDTCEFMLMDINEDSLEAARLACTKILREAKSAITLKTTTCQKEALEGCNYLITSCEQNRYENWVKDIEIPAKHGVNQLKGENGGPGGMVHAMRNICMFKSILDDMEELCPDAWLMNFTNPMSILCTYFKNYSSIKALGFCHQVHGSFGVIAEMLGMQPGDLEVLAAGVNHLSWLFDIRKKGSAKSYMNEFIKHINESKWWKSIYKNVPEQIFTMEVFKTFNMYPVGYDDHIIEYLPFFWEESEWSKHDIEPYIDEFRKLAAEKKQKVLSETTLLGDEYSKPPFPKDPSHPHYAEKPCQVIVALETNTPAYLESINIINNGAVGNLPSDAILDVPALVVAGDVRSIHVGDLPLGAMEICRRQVTLHEMIAQAAHDGDDNLAIQALCLDPYVNSITQAKNIWADFRKEYKEYLTTFK